MEALQEFFEINHTIVLFGYGLTFFVLGLAIFLNSRHQSRLRLARDLYWLAAFGLIHGIYEWGDVFIPIQSTYLSYNFIELLWLLHILLLVVSFACLLMFGVVSLDRRWPHLKRLVVGLIALWVFCFLITRHITSSDKEWLIQSKTWARYLLGFPGGLLAAYGLRYQAQVDVLPLSTHYIYRSLRVAGMSIFAYAIFAGIIVSPGNFFPANVLNITLVKNTIGLPIEVFRSLAGLVLVVAMIKALEVFEIEVDRVIEQAEIKHIQSAERERIGQEIHDGAIQGVYSVILILESVEPHIPTDSEAARRLQQACSVLNAVNHDLHNYMVSLRVKTPSESLIPSLKNFIADPRFHGLLDIHLQSDGNFNLKPLQIHHILSIVQESLVNTLRHARAQRVDIALQNANKRLALQMKDDGRGFSPESTPTGYGLRSMYDHARLLGATLEIDSAPGSGTTITLILPEENL